MCVYIYIAVTVACAVFVVAAAVSPVLSSFTHDGRTTTMRTVVVAAVACNFHDRDDNGNDNGNERSDRRGPNRST